MPSVLAIFKMRRAVLGEAQHAFLNSSLRFSSALRDF
jgi:hypothetical protein